MKKTFCDRCGKEEDEGSPICSYQVLAKVEQRDLHPGDDELEFGLEFDIRDLCQPCVRLIAEACKKFISTDSKKETP